MYETITSGAYNLSSDPTVLFCYTNNVVEGMFINILLFAIFMVIVISTYQFQKKATGIGDFPVAMMVASFTTFVFTILLKLISSCELVSSITLAIVIIMAVLSFGFLLFSRD